MAERLAADSDGASLRARGGDTPVWDNHACMPMRPGDDSFLPMLEEVRRSGTDVLSLNAAFGSHTGSQADAMLDQFHRWIADHDDTLMLVLTPADADAARATNRLGICFDLESMSVLDGDPARVAHFYQRGVRWMLGTYNTANAACGGCLEPDGGLSAFGRAVVAEMNRVGMVVCASHCGYRSARELIDQSATPVIFSHSNALTLWPHPRNIPDTLIRACAERGGVIGINGFGGFLGQEASVETLVRHVEHVLDLVGDDHVGIALDYVFDRAELDLFIAADPVAFPPEAYPQGGAMIGFRELPAIAECLAARGHSPTTLGRILGGNHRRIATQVWQ